MTIVAQVQIALVLKLFNVYVYIHVYFNTD